MATIFNTVFAARRGAALTAGVLGIATFMVACSTVQPSPVARAYTQEQLAPMVQVPAGHVIALETTTTGLLHYECRANAATGGTINWALVRPQAELQDRNGKTVVIYSGPPPTWTHIDGSSVVGSQLAVAPIIGLPINLPNQLSKATPGGAPGVLENITYIQRVRIKGGQEFMGACTQMQLGNKETVKYQADYIFWKAA